MHSNNYNRNNSNNKRRFNNNRNRRPMRDLKIEAKTMDEAIAIGLKKLNLRKEQTDIKVIQKAGGGFLGIGSKNAIISINKKRWTNNSTSGNRNNFRNGGRTRQPFNKNGRDGNRFPKKDAEPKKYEKQNLPSEEIQNAVVPENIKEPMVEAKKMLEKTFTEMGVKVENLQAWWDAKHERILLTFDCDSPAIVIGTEGKNLEAVQYLITITISRNFKEQISVIADTQNYWNKAEKQLDYDINKSLSIIKKTHKEYRFKPMSPQLRKYIHKSLAGNEDVETISEGEGKLRKVVVRIASKETVAEAPKEASAEAKPEVLSEAKVKEELEAKIKAMETPAEEKVEESSENSES
ncbi:MAG: hypothetical protein HOD04_04200 [Elusimicrobiaceae bacterium]|nr:hypothetical protein [Elusimicrobiaceae bacterium]MBT4440119.1 hypothetical protein [Elusimicrobiaceae bacterium]MBT6715347.1 hypothetical protein [Elusimicrobiaceae bacterium]